MFCWIILSRMRPLAKPSCGKWPHMDPLAITFHQNYNFYMVFTMRIHSFPWTMTFPFWAIWALFSKDCVVPPCILVQSQEDMFLCHKKTWPGQGRARSQSQAPWIWFNLNMDSSNAVGLSINMSMNSSTTINSLLDCFGAREFTIDEVSNMLSFYAFFR